MPRVIHFEIPAKDPAKAVDFYHTVFDWKIQKWDGPMDYWLVGTGENGTPGIDGGIYTPEQGINGTVNTIDVPDIHAYLAKVTAAHGVVVAPVHEIPGMGLLAYCKDTEGNLFGMMQMYNPE
jgi:predicted enzyme related to lactoylglutathione lyase